MTEEAKQGADEDEAQLRALGYDSEFDRTMSFWSNFALGFTYLSPVVGVYSVFAMAVPYCMIHFNKPLAEVLGAILAGTILGTLSLRTRSIWCGVLIHVTVAVSMDLLSLMQTAGWPGNPRWIG